MNIDGNIKREPIQPLVPLPLGIYKFRDVGTKMKSDYILDKIDISRFQEYQLYGVDRYNVEHYWKGYQLSKKNMTVKLTGISGSGKTTVAEVLCNKALDAGMSVIKVSEIKGSMELYVLIERMSNVVIMFDEYEKTFSPDLQNRMLNMFSSSDTPKKLFLITSNFPINEFMDNRLGRVLYGQDFTRIRKSSYDEFIKVNCPNINEKFLKELNKKYKTSRMFTIDNLKFILDEHKKFPNLTFDEIINILNLPAMSGGGVLKLTRVYDRQCKQELKFIPINIDKDNFITDGWGVHIYVYEYIELEKDPETNNTTNLNDITITNTDSDPFGAIIEPLNTTPTGGRSGTKKRLPINYKYDLMEINDEIHTLLVSDRYEITIEES